MAARAVTMLAAAALIVVAAVLAGGASAQSSGCTQTLIGMSPCLNYITGNETAPSKSCCSQLATVVSSRPECLCVALNADPVSPELLRPESRGYLMVIFALSSLVTHALTSAAKDTHEILEYYLSRGGN
ncbi:hypothetical protein VPH35_006384 [Triticum aestivum]|uniref:Bifunctional inhibitor/plant lipid transfer protein/seed storage helical domain-containing protein n=1 Tax=Triticum aestivum TaxID=4565 RepID=A0A3B5YRL5_WHEAT